ncbi:MAG: polyhydroxyalkanoate depolymerase [Clostridiaceae bacterium]
MIKTSKTYYVSSLKGDDQNDGLSELTPFRSLTMINHIKLKPGDTILLECGSVFQYQFLHITACGTKEQPIEISSYGDGPYPVIHGNGQGIWYQDYGVPLDSKTHVRAGYVSSTILLYDSDNILVQNIELTNYPQDIPGESYSYAHKMNRTGVAVVAKNKGTLRNITLRNLYIHDVQGNVYDKHMNNGGIYITALQPDDEKKTGVARYDGIIIEESFVYRVSRWGIAVGYTYNHSKFIEAELQENLFLLYGHENIVLRNNYVKEAGGDGITPMYALRPIIEHNTVDSVAQEMNDRIYRYPENRLGKVAAAIWPWKCKDAVFRYNEAVDTRLNQDGMAYDADSGDGTSYEYNYSRLNEGGCVMFCLEQSINNKFMNNISYDDLGGTISPAENPDAYIAYNKFFKRKRVPFVRKNMDGGSYIEEHNEFIEI